MLVREFFAPSGDPVKAYDTLQGWADHLLAHLSPRSAAFASSHAGYLEDLDLDCAVWEWCAGQAVYPYKEVEDLPCGFVDDFIAEYGPYTLDDHHSFSDLILAAATCHREAEIREDLTEIARYWYTCVAASHLGALEDCPEEVDESAISEAIDKAAEEAPEGPYTVDQVIDRLPLPD